MKRIALLLFLVASPALGQGALTHLRIFDAGSIPATCDPEGRLYIVTGAASSTACDGTTGTSTALCACDSAGTGYVAVSGSGGGHSDGANCAAGEIPLGVDANGAVQGCYEPAEADISDLAHTTDTNLTQEEVEDFAGAMVTGNTETRITVTYQDADGTVDFVVDDMNDDQPDSDAEVPDAITVDGGAILNSTVTLDTGTDPTADGQLRWDSTTERLEIGDDGAATLELYPGAHTTNTNADTICTGTTTYLDGEGNCDTIAGGGLSNVVEDTTPQLGGQLDVNGFDLGDGTLELLSFMETASAVNEVTITNAATGGGPTISATGDDTDVGLNLISKGSGSIDLDPQGGTVTVDTGSNGTNWTFAANGPLLGHSSNSTTADLAIANDTNTGLDWDGTDVLDIVAGSQSAIYIQTVAAVATVTIDDALELDPQSAPPVTCAAGTEGTLYADSSSNELCFCDGTSWTGLKAGGTCA